MLQIPLRYRPAGDASWRDGRSENISRSGVLFLADYSPTVETPIELLLGLGGDIGHDVAGTLSCRGRVVRIEPPRGEDPRAAVAATIGGCEILHNQGDDPRRI